MLEPGDPAPEVTARNQHGESVTPDFAEPTVVYFYPKDFTGGCTIEANDFQDAYPEFEELGVAVYGVSMDDVESHADFAEAEGSCSTCWPTRTGRWRRRSASRPTRGTPVA